MRQNWNGTADKVFDKQVAAFTTAYPNINVKTELVPYGDLGVMADRFVAAPSGLSSSAPASHRFRTWSNAPNDRLSCAPMRR